MKPRCLQLGWESRIPLASRLLAFISSSLISIRRASVGAIRGNLGGHTKLGPNGIPVFDRKIPVFLQVYNFQGLHLERMSFGLRYDDSANLQYSCSRSVLLPSQNFHSYLYIVESFAVEPLIALLGS